MNPNKVEEALRGEFESAEFIQFNDPAPQSKSSIPTEANARRIQVGDYPFNPDPFVRPRPTFEPRTRVIITCPNGNKLYWSLTASQLTMLTSIIDNGGWEATVQYEKPQDWQTF